MNFVGIDEFGRSLIPDHRLSAGIREIEHGEPDVGRRKCSWHLLLQTLWKTKLLGRSDGSRHEEFDRLLPWFIKRLVPPLEIPGMKQIVVNVVRKIRQQFDKTASPLSERWGMFLHHCLPFRIGLRTTSSGDEVGKFDSGPRRGCLLWASLRS